MLYDVTCDEKFILMNHLNLFKIKFKIVSNIQWLKDSLSECDTIFVIIIFSWNYTRRVESQKYIYLDNIFGIHDKILGARLRARKTKIHHPSYIIQENINTHAKLWTTMERMLLHLKIWSKYLLTDSLYQSIQKYVPSL